MAPARDNVLHLLLLSRTCRRMRAACSHPSCCGEGPGGGRVRGESLARMAVLALRREMGAGAARESSLGRRGSAWIRSDHFRDIKAGKAWPEMSKNVCYTFIAGIFFAYI